jgi:hypothetical protein
MVSNARVVFGSGSACSLSDRTSRPGTKRLATRVATLLTASPRSIVEDGAVGFDDARAQRLALAQAAAHVHVAARAVRDYLQGMVEAGGVHAQRLEDPLDDELVVRLAGDARDDHPEQRIRGVGVRPALARILSQAVSAVAGELSSRFANP